MSPFDSPVDAYMSSPVASITGGAALVEAERLLDARNVSALAVVGDSGQLVGVLSRTDLIHVGRRRASMARDTALLTLPHLYVRQRMVSPVVTVSPDAPLREAAALLCDHHIHRVFVTVDQRPVGVLSTRDVIRAVADARTAEPLRTLMSRPVLTVDATATLAQATDQLERAHLRGLVVVDGDWPIGLFTQREALTARRADADLAVEAVMSLALLCLPESLPLFRAAHFALASRARHILAVEARQMHGIVSGLDFARVAAGR
jgi:CBS domain-containing protein